MSYIFKLFCLSFLFLSINSCTTPDAEKKPLSDIPPKNNNLAEAALQSVQDSMQLDPADFERVQSIVLKYEDEIQSTQKQKFNNPKSKQQVMQNLMKSRRAELGDVLKLKEVNAFNKLYKQSLAKERKNRNKEKQMSEADRKALSGKLKEYRQTSVLPIIVKHRKALEAAMSPTDKTQTAGLRQKIKDFNQQTKAKQADCKAIDEANKKALMACRRELRDMQKQYTSMQKEVKTFNDLLLTKAETKSIMTDMENQRTVWRADLKKILTPYMKKELEEDKIPLGKYLRLVQPTTFLLLDPTKLNSESGEQ